MKKEQIHFKRMLAGGLAAFTLANFPVAARTCGLYISKFSGCCACNGFFKVAFIRTIEFCERTNHDSRYGLI